MRQPPNGEASHETQPGCKKNGLHRIPSHQLPGFANRVFQVMLPDVRSDAIELACRPFRDVSYRFGTLLPALPNRGRSGMKASGCLAAKIVHLLRYPGSVLIEQRR
jgi:hypothetical protein